MFKVKKLLAEYKESIKHETVEEITDHAEEDYFPGYIPFYYDYIKDTTKEVVAQNIVKEKKFKVLSTYADLPFKRGDIVRIGLEDYEISQVDKVLPKQFQTLVSTSSSLLDRYTKKDIYLYDN